MGGGRGTGGMEERKVGKLGDSCRRCRDLRKQQVPLFLGDNQSLYPQLLQDLSFDSFSVISDSKALYGKCARWPMIQRNVESTRESRFLRLERHICLRSMNPISFHL